MSSLKYIGNVERMTVTLASDYTSGSGSMDLTTGHGARLPATGDYWIVTTSGTYRAFKVTARSTDTLTVVAGQDGTSDDNLSAGQELEWNITASAFAQVLSDNRYGGGLLTAPPITGWSTLNASDSTISYPNDQPRIQKPSSVGDDTTSLVRTVSVPYTITTCIDYRLMGSQYPNAGIQLSDGSTKMICFGVIIVAGYQRAHVAYRTGTTYNSEPSTAKYDNPINVLWGNMPPLWLRIANNSTNRVYSLSFDGTDWVQFATDAAGAHLTEDRAGIFANAGIGSSSAYRPVIVSLNSWLVG